MRWSLWKDHSILILNLVPEKCFMLETIIYLGLLHLIHSPRPNALRAAVKSCIFYSFLFVSAIITDLSVLTSVFVLVSCLSPFNADFEVKWCYSGGQQ